MKHHLKSIWEFFITYIRSLNPASYIELSSRMYRNMFHYFFSLIFVAVVALLVLSIPKLIFFPSYIEQQFDKFQKLDVNVDAPMKAPILLTDAQPLVAIDTTGNFTDISNLPVKLLITDKKIQFKSSFATVYESDISGFSNVLQHQSAFKHLILYIVIAALPTILLALFILFALKYMVILLIAIPLCFGITRVFKGEVRFRSIVRICFYAITAMITLDIITMALGIAKFSYAIPFILGLDLYVASLLAFLFYISVGIVLVSMREQYDR